jgi:hypothetical protein
MPRGRREWLRLSWCLIIVLGLAAAVACASHPPGHDQHVGHPPLCTDTDNPATLGYGKPTLSTDGGTRPLPLKSLFPAMLRSALGNELLIGLRVWLEVLSESDTRTSVSPPMFLVVLRQ